MPEYLRTDSVANLGQNELEVRLAEGGRVLLDGLDKGEGLDPATLGILWRYDPKNWAGVISDNLDGGPLVRILVSTTNHLEKRKALKNEAKES